MYLAYALFCEGASDFSYFEVLVPRVIQSTILTIGRAPVDVPERPSLRLGRKNRSVEAVAQEACNGRDAFHLVFVHADTGGRGQQARLDNRSTAYCTQMYDKCQLRPARCALLRPAPMTESWALADPEAVLETLGYRGTPSELDLPGDAAQAETHPDPKACLDTALRLVRGVRRSRGGTLLPGIAQRQSIDALRRSDSFQGFEYDLLAGLRDLGVVEG